MNKKKFLVVALGAMLVCPGMQATVTEGLKSASKSALKVGENALKNPGTACAVVTGELVGCAGLSFGVASFVTGLRLAVPAALNIVRQGCRVAVGKERSMPDSEYGQQWQNLAGAAREMIGGSFVIGLSIAEMKWAMSWLAD